MVFFEIVFPSSGTWCEVKANQNRLRRAAQPCYSATAEVKKVANDVETTVKSDGVWRRNDIWQEMHIGLRNASCAIHTGCVRGLILNTGSESPYYEG
jgi:hypothetical protein